MNTTTIEGGAGLPPFRPLDMLPPDIALERRADGTILLSQRHAPAEAEHSIPHLFARQAAAFPDRAFLAQRGPSGEWDRLTYGAMKAQADAVAAALLARGLDQSSPVMVLSGNSLAHGILMMGAMTAGVPIAPVSVAYSLMSGDHAKLRHVFGIAKPRMVFAENGALFGKALAALPLDGVEVVTVEGAPEGVKATAFADLLATRPGPEVAAAMDRIRPDSVAKLLFTSGSTGMPKGAIQTHGMLTAGIAVQQGLRLPETDDEIPTILEWMPWNHISAGNISFNNTIANAGTIFLDAGRPIPGMFDETIRNLKEISPTTYGSAPIAFSMLADAMERDDALRESFFRRLKVLGYGGATLSPDLYERIQALAIRTTGRRMVLTTMYGATETQGITVVHWVTDRVGLIGLPLPGITLKLVPNGLKMEVRVKGPTVTPGYKDRPDLNEGAFDEEGFYRLGDAARFLDENDPAQGLVFDGRVTEDFKLSSGTWVSVGTLRAELIAALSPLVQDAVICGLDRDYVAVLAWPNMLAAREIAGDPSLSDPAAILASPKIVAHAKAALAAHNAGAGGSSGKVRRLMLMTEPPSVDGHEITDKGYINQRATLERRADLVKALYADPPGPGIVAV